MVVKSTHIIHLEQYFKYDTVLEQVSIVNLKMPIITKENKVRVNRDGASLKKIPQFKIPKAPQHWVPTMETESAR